MGLFKKQIIPTLICYHTIDDLLKDLESMPASKRQSVIDFISQLVLDESHLDDVIYGDKLTLTIKNQRITIK